MAKRAPKSRTKPEGRNLLPIMLGVGVIAIVLIVLFLLAARADEATIPASKSAELTMDQISANLQKYGMKYDFKKVGSVNSDTDLDQLASTVVESAVVVSPDLRGHLFTGTSDMPEFKILRLGEELNATPDAIAALKHEARESISLGDEIYRVQVSGPSKTASTTVVMSADGKKKVGMFLNASRIPVPTPRPNPLDKKVESERILVLTHYLWNAPAETLYGKIRGQCGDATCNSCQLVEARGESGFFARISTSPKAIADGRIVGNCCRESINYEVETGFTSFSVEGGALEGHLGQSSDGSMFLEACGQ